MDSVDNLADNNNKVSQGSSMATCNASNLDPNWQTTKLTLKDKNAVMFNNPLMSDITFVVGPSGHKHMIPAHKYVLAIGSPVFYAMFYGGLAECNQEIEIPDVEPSAFLTLLKYLYTDFLNFRYLYTDEIDQLEEDTVMSTYYVAKKYIVPHLSEACVTFLKIILTANNVCQLISEPQLIDELDLMKRCWEVIDEQADLVLKSDAFLDIDVSTLGLVLSRETLHCKEINIFEAALAWAGVACVRKNMDPSPTNKRAMLGNDINLIRFPTMSSEEFANSVALSGILNHQENNDIFLHFLAANKPSLPYPTQPRTYQITQICHRYQSDCKQNWPCYDKQFDAIDFSVDKTIFLIGFGLYGSYLSQNYDVIIQLYKDTSVSVLAENKMKICQDKLSKTFHVYFEKPIKIEPKRFYTAMAKINVKHSHGGTLGLLKVCVGAVEFQFRKSELSLNDTHDVVLRSDVSTGQIPELIFKM